MMDTDPLWKELESWEATNTIEYIINNVPLLMEYCFHISLELFVSAIYEIKETKFRNPL